MAVCKESYLLKVHVFKVDKPARSEYGSLVDIYIKRLNSWGVESTFLSSRAGPDRLEQKVKEKLSKLAKPCLVSLDERGKQWSSPVLASKLKTWSEDPEVRNLVFLVGGPYGLGRTILESSKEVWALGSGVFPSDLAWLILWEQLFRAHSINVGSSYHHE